VWICSDIFIANFRVNVTVEQFWKLSIFGEVMDKSLVSCFLTHSVEKYVFKLNVFLNFYPNTYISTMSSIIFSDGTGREDITTKTQRGSSVVFENRYVHYLQNQRWNDRMWSVNLYRLVTSLINNIESTRPSLTRHLSRWTSLSDARFFCDWEAKAFVGVSSPCVALVK